MPKTKKTRSVDQIAGKGATATADGTEYYFAPVKLEMLMGEASAIVRSMGIDAISRNISLGANPIERRQAIASASMMSVPIVSALEFLNTWEGTLWLIEKSLKEKHSEVKAGDIQKWGYEKVLEIGAMVDGLSGTLEDSEEGGEADAQGGSENPTPETDGGTESAS